MACGWLIFNDLAGGWHPPIHIPSTSQVVTIHRKTVDGYALYWNLLDLGTRRLKGEQHSPHG